MLVNAVEKRTKFQGPEHPDTLLSELNLGIVLVRSGRYHDAEPHLRNVVFSDGSPADSSPEVQYVALLWFGVVLMEEGHYQEARDVLERSIDGLRRTVGADDPRTLNAIRRMAIVLARQGDFTAAIDLQRSVVEAFGRTDDAEQPETQRVGWVARGVLACSGRERRGPSCG